MAKESLITKDVWDSKIIRNRAKTVGCKGTRQNVTLKGTCKDGKAQIESKDFVQREWTYYNE